MIAYKDFVPRQLKAPALSFNLAEAAGTYETFHDAVTAANVWLSQNPVRLIQLETVVLPNVWMRWEQGTEDASLRTGEAAQWHQFLRVWYEPE